MKSDIKEVSYKDSTVEETGSGWFAWTEICDRCGSVIQKSGDVICLRPKEINTEGDDLCINCLRFLIDSGLRFNKSTGKDYIK